MKLNQFITELRSRGVYRVAAIYSAGAWALLQVADVMFPIIGLPDWSITVVLLTAALGFPVAIIASWLFDLTPQGIVETGPVVESVSRKPMSIGHIIQLTLIVLLTFLVGYLYMERLSDMGEPATPGGQSQRPSIAVVPFVNMSDLQRMEYLGDGLAEEILNLLAKLNELDVAARTSSFYFKNKNMDIRSIGEQLNVSHVLEGSVRHDQGRVRVTAQLIDVSNGYHLWSETYDRELGSMLALQDEIADKVVTILQVLLSEESRATLDRSIDVDPVSYDYYLQGRAYLRKPKGAANLEIAKDLFNKAIATDADFADSHAGLCDTLLGLYSIDMDIAKFHDAETACQRALALDRRATSVYVALGNLYRTSGQYEKAIEEFKIALSLTNVSADAYLGLAGTYKENNQLTLAEQAYHTAIELQPNYWLAFMSLGNFLFETGRIEEATPYYLRMTELMPDSAIALNNLAVTLFLSGDFTQAKSYWQQSLELAPSAVAYANVATSLYFMEQYGEAVELYHKAVEFAPDDGELWGNLGDAYSQLPEGAELAVPMYNNAIKLAEKRLQINSSDADTLILLGLYQASIGQQADALKNVDQALTLAPGNMTVNYVAATALARMNKWTRSMDALENAIALGYPWHLASADINLKELRNLPRYEALAAQQQ